MPNYSFYIPLLYTFHTRLKTCMKTFSLVIIYVIPVLYILLLECNGAYPTVVVILSGCFAIISVYNVYETGYIQNDTETIKQDKSPTIRLSSNNFDYYRRHKKKIYAFRTGLFILFSFLHCLFFDVQSLIMFETSLLAIFLVYQWYNRRRDRLLIFRYFLLVSLRYIAPLLIYPEHFSWKICIVALMVFPLVKSLSIKAENDDGEKYNPIVWKYILKCDKQRLTEYRAVSYGILLCINLLLYVLNIFSLSYCLPVLYMFVYRTSIWLIVIKGFKPAGYLKG